MIKKSLEKSGKADRPDFLTGDFDVSKLEEAVLAWWQSEKIFEKSLEQTKDGKPFVFYDGPPFATGLPHYGHLLASTMKDLIPRYQTMRGRYVRRRWGWDCHGLPIEELVERKLGISGKKQIEEIGIKKFNETCRSVVLEFADAWEKMVNRIARWVEFSDSYKTMDADYMESVWWGFKQAYDKDLVYAGKRVLLYCPRCETPVSNFEVAMDNSYKDVTEESVYVKFKVKNPEKINLKNQDVYLLAWTTTPWTLPGNVALAIGGDIEYLIQKINVRQKDQKNRIKNDDVLITAKARWPDFEGANFSTEGISGDFVAVVQGKDLVGLEYEPLFDVPAMKGEKSYKVYAADFVKTDEGTGIVHTAVVYGEDDYALGVCEGLPIVPMLDERGHFNDKAPELVRGKYFKGAEKEIKEDLEKRGLLFRREMHLHSYPHCWRCGNMLYYNAIPAWFINVQKIKSDLIKSNDREINWFPDHLKHGRYEKSVEAAPDWNISRNRYWGNPIPVWRCEGCAREEAMGGLDELAKKAGTPKNHYVAMRHGEAFGNVFGIIDSGDQKFNLTAEGVREVEARAEALREKKIDLIFSSDLERAKESAEIVAKKLGVKNVHYDARLHEIYLASLSGRPLEEYQELFSKKDDRFEKHVVPGSESLQEVRTRAWQFLKDVEKEYKGKNILIVSHEDTIWMLEQAALGWSDRKAASLKARRPNAFLEPAGLVEFDMKRIPRNDTGEADLHRPYIDEITFPCNACGKNMRRTPEIFDSWMEAGSMPFAEYHYPFENKETFESRFPAQFVVEYIAQTRAWFYVMHVLSFIIFGKAPFENVVTTGNVLNEKGEKLSKSKQNYPDPWLTINKYGADALRFELMGSAAMQSEDLYWTEQDVVNAYRKVELLLVNVYKYLETYSFTEDASGGSVATSDDGTDILDRWIETRTMELVETVSVSLDAYDTVRATRMIQAYVDDLSTWYLRRSRRRKDPAFFKTLSESLMTTSKVLAPFMPYLAEALYQGMRGYVNDPKAAESVHLAEWPKVMSHESRVMSQESLLDAMAEVRRLASLGLAKRAEAKIKVRQPLASLRTRSEIGKAKDQGFPQILKDEVNVKEILFDGSLAEDVVLDTAITPALREEGWVREIARMIQELRQKAELSPKDKVIVMTQLDGDMQHAILKNEAVLKSDVGAQSIEYKKSEKSTAEIEAKSENQEIWIGIRKV